MGYAHITDFVDLEAAADKCRSANRYRRCCRRPASSRASSSTSAIASAPTYESAAASVSAIGAYEHRRPCPASASGIYLSATVTPSGATSEDSGDFTAQPGLGSGSVERGCEAGALLTLPVLRQTATIRLSVFRRERKFTHE